MEHKRIAIITGASSGLGRELARQLDTEGLEECWAIARREDRLQELAKSLKTPVRPLPMDLTDPAAAKALAALLQKEQPQVCWLVNAAGYGRIGSFADIPDEDALKMIDLNCRAPVAVTQAALSHMAPGGHILQVCSTAAFQPLPFLNVYAATKAFLYRYSRGLGAELKAAGSTVTVTALCPYWIKDTEFIGTAQATGGGAAVKSFPLASRRADVAKSALRAAKRGKAVCTPGPMCSVHRVLGKLSPSALNMAVWGAVRKL